MRRLAAFTALLAIPACSGTLDLPYSGGGDVPTPELPDATPSPTGTPIVPSEFPDDAGDGHDGPLIVGPGATVKINPCAAVSLAELSTVTVGASGGTTFMAGQRVLVWQVQDTFAMSGNQAPVTSPGGAGLFEIRRIAGVGGTTLTLETSLANRYESTSVRTAQVCRLPEYTTVTVPAGSTITGDPWNGASGGIVAFFANDAVTIDGEIDARGIGFRGGVRSSGANGGEDNVQLNTSSASGGGKGEGVDRAGFALFGRGNYANGAGGGNTRNAGGGGGGGGGAGGSGGRQSLTNGNIDGTKGLGGAAIAPADLRLTFGGGGGGGHQNDNLTSAGGSGGGLVLLIARAFAATVAGSIDARGNDGQGNGNAEEGDGAGGGGAGGTVVVLSAEAGGGPWGGEVRVSGGVGGSINDVNDNQGAGGGGGGGRVLTNDAGFTLDVDLAGGVNGVNTQFMNDPNGAQTGATGAVTSF